SRPASRRQSHNNPFPGKCAKSAQKALPAWKQDETIPAVREIAPFSLLLSPFVLFEIVSVRRNRCFADLQDGFAPVPLHPARQSGNGERMPAEYPAWDYQ